MCHNLKKLVFVLLTITIASSLFAQKADCFILKAPEKPFYDIKKIGVLEFECKNNYRMSSFMTDQLVADLLRQNRGIYDTQNSWYGIVKGKEGKTYVKGVKTDFYQVIERDQLEKVLKEQRLSLSGAIDESSAAEVGRILGLDAIIMGSVSYSSVDKRSGTDYPCLKRTVTAKGTMKIISVKTGQVVGTKSAESTLYVQKCSDERSEVPSDEVIAESCMKNLARQFTDYFAPGYQPIEYDFEKVKLKEFKQKAKEAEDYLDNGDLDRAFPIIYAMYEADSYNPKAAYNLGVLYEMVGANSEAHEYYSIAYELDYSNTKFADAEQRAKAGIGVNNYLEDIGRPVQPYTFTSGNGIADALAERVQVKGNSGDRVEVYELPDKTSEVVAKVPGGLEFKVISESGGFYKIQLRGTKTGFIRKSDVK